MAGQQVVRQNGGGGVARPEATLRSLLEQREEEFGKALAGRVDPQAFVRVAYTTITKSPKLMEATPASVLMALLECATLGLVPNGVMGEAYLVPFKNKVKEGDGRERWEVQAQFIPGYRGLIKLARNTGVIRNIVARPVYGGDTFEVQYGSEERLQHVPDLSAAGPRNLTHVWAMAFFTDGLTQQFEVMTKAEVDKIRARSKSKDDGPWVTDYSEMGLKTVTRRLCKRLPISDVDQSFARALEADNSDFMDVSDVATQGQRVRLTERFGAPPALPAPTLPDFPIPHHHEDLDAVGLTGDVHQAAEARVAVRVPSPAPPPRSSGARQPVAEAGDPDLPPPAPGKVSALRALVDDTRPSGKTPAVSEEQRASLRRVAHAVAVADERLADALLGLADASDPKLSRQQAQLLTNAGFAAAEELGVASTLVGDELPLEG